MCVIGRDEGSGLCERAANRLVECPVDVNEDEVGGRGKFGYESREVAEAQFDFGMQGVERVAGREEKGGGSAGVDGAGGQWKQPRRMRIGDEQDAGSGRDVGKRRADGADYVKGDTGSDEAQGRIGDGEIDGETGRRNEAREEGLAEVGVEGFGEAGQGELAGGEAEIGVEVRANTLAEEFELYALSCRLSHAAIITRFKRGV